MKNLIIKSTSVLAAILYAFAIVIPVSAVGITPSYDDYRDPSCISLSLMMLKIARIQLRGLNTSVKF